MCAVLCQVSFQIFILKPPWLTLGKGKQSRNKAYNYGRCLKWWEEVLAKSQDFHNSLRLTGFLKIKMIQTWLSCSCSKDYIGKSNESYLCNLANFCGRQGESWTTAVAKRPYMINLTNMLLVGSGNDAKKVSDAAAFLRKRRELVS